MEAVDTVQWEHNVEHKDPTPTQHFFVCMSDFDVFSQLLPGPKKNQYLIFQPNGRFG